MLFILPFALFGLVVSQVPQCTNQPQQWEAREFHFESSRRFETYGKLSYDQTNMRWRHIEEVGNLTTRNYYDRLYIHSLGLEYQLDLKTRICTKRTVTGGFRYRGVPPGSHFVFEASVGAAGIPGEHSSVAFFNGTFEDKTHYTVTATLPDCFIISGNERNATNPSEFTVRNYFDMNAGITDPNVFVPPRECTTL